MDRLAGLVDVFVHLDVHLNAWGAQMGWGLYALLFAIVFCETGLVVLPFLPGDSLLFTAGALASRADSPLSLPVVIVLLSTAAILGDAVNYAVGKRLRPHLVGRKDNLFFKQKHLVAAHAFYERHGKKAIILARFIPVLRTFAPFAAGVSRMNYARFAVYNAFGGSAWVLSLTVTGYLFADLPMVKQHFHYVVVAILFISSVPVLVEFIRPRRGPPLVTLTPPVDPLAPAPGRPLA